MKITCVIMAGGKSSRMKTLDEKTIIPILGKAMIDYVIEAALGSNVDEVLVAISQFTPKTTEIIKKFNIKIVQTAGKGYHEDLRQVLETFNLEIVLTISGDLPLIKSEDINRIIEFYKKSKKPSLSVMAPVEDLEKFEIKPSYVMEYEGQKLIPIGINMLDGRIEKNIWQEQALMIVNNPQFLFNVNTESDLNIINKFLKN
ncbi:MAG: NTP transferase domain-containing protein [Promethearchaeota archaeon]